MKVFLSWSGERSRKVAEALRDWLPDVINAVEPWMSTEIDKGTPSMQEIATALRDCAFGLICVTPGNKNTPWINYEAGALSKAVGDDPARVATLLVDCKFSDVTGPLAQFQGTRLELEDFKRLMRNMDQMSGSGREATRVDRIVDKLWPDLKKNLDAAVALKPAKAPTPVKRTNDEKIDEILEAIRDLTRSVTPTQTLVQLLADFQMVSDRTRRESRQFQLLIEELRRRRQDLQDIDAQSEDNVEAQREALRHIMIRHVPDEKLRHIRMRFPGKDVVAISQPLDDNTIARIENDVQMLTQVRPKIIFDPRLFAESDGQIDGSVN